MHCLTIEPETRPLREVAAEAEASLARRQLAPCDACLGAELEKLLHRVAYEIGKTTPPQTTRQHLKSAGRAALVKAIRRQELPREDPARERVALCRIRAAMHQLAAEEWSAFNRSHPT